MSTPESTSPPRRVPGQDTMERLERRTKRRPNIGMSPEFYARFGLSDPWSDTALEMQEDPGALFTYVDASRYRKMMRRLAVSRWRRERRARIFDQRRLGERTAMRRAFPGEAKRKFGFGVRTLSSHEMIVPEKLEPEVVQVAAQGRPRFRGSSMRSVSSPWASTAGAPARSVTTASSTSAERQGRVALRPTQVMGARLAAVRAAKDPVLKAIDAAMPRMDNSTRRRIQSKLAAVEHLDDQTRAIEIRKVLRTVRRVQTVYEEQIVDSVPSALARPTEIARARTLPASSRRRGLRPILGRSPSMDVLSTPVPVDEALQAQRKSPGTQRALARSTTKQASGWARPSVVVSTTRSNSMLSASPVARSSAPKAPHAGAPSVRTASSTTPGSSAVRTASSITARSAALRTARGSTPVSSTIRTGASDTKTSGTLRTAGSDTQRSEAQRTRSAPVVGSDAFKTASGLTTGAKSGETGSQAIERSKAVRTKGGESQGAKVASTSTSATERSESIRTQSTESVGARSGTTAASESVGARTATSGASPSASTTRSGSTGPGGTTGVGVYRSGGTQTSLSEGLGTASSTTQGARVFGGTSDELSAEMPQRRASTAHAAARISHQATSEQPTAPAVLERREGRFVPPTRSASQEAPAAQSHGAWAMERLERTGTSNSRKGSILPRMAPRAPESTYVVHADESVDVQALVEQIKRAAPGAQVRVTEKATAWGPSSVSKAAERSVKSPLVSRAAAQSSTAVQSVVAGNNDKVRRSKNPISYARQAKRETVQRSVPELATLSSMGPAVQKVLGGTMPSQAVKTRDGVWIPAASFSTPSAGSWAAARAFLTGATSGAGAGTFQTGATRGAGAGSFQTGATRGAGAGSFQTGASGGAGASVFRTQRGQGGAKGFRGVSTLGDGEQTFLASDPQAPGAVRNMTARGEMIGTRSERPGPVSWAGARTQLTAQSQGRGAETFRGGASHFAPGERVNGPGRSIRGAARSTGATLEALAAREMRGDSPSWAERSTRPTRVRSPGDLIEQLVQAQDVEQLVDLIVNRGSELQPSMGLSKPVLQVIEQIRSVAAAEQNQGQSSRSGRRSGVGARASGRRRSAKVVRGFASIKGGAATIQSGVGPDKVMKLAGKLRSLIHLAEGGRMGDAQRQAKLAHGDRPEGQMEQGGDLSNSETAAKQSVDIEALAREVLEVVNREMELRQERRQEESDANVWW
jgi:hypothetical protein